MDLLKLVEVTINACEFIDNIIYFQDIYIVKINDLIGDLEKTINGAANHSTEYVNSKTDEIQFKINSYLNALNIKIEEKLEGFETWYKDQMDTAKYNLAAQAISMAGKEPTDEAIKLIIDILPTPELPMPEFKITIPDEIFDDIELSENIKLPRIPLIEIPGIDVSEIHEDIKGSLYKTKSAITKFNETQK